MSKSAAVLLAVILGLTNLSLALAGYVVSRRRFPDMIEPLHVQFILLGCGVLLVATIAVAQSMRKGSKAPPLWLYGLSEVPAVLSFLFLGWRGHFFPSTLPLICSVLVQFAVLLPGAAKIGR